MIVQSSCRGWSLEEVCLQEKATYMRELEELIPQMEMLIQDKTTLEEQVYLCTCIVDRTTPPCKHTILPDDLSVTSQPWCLVHQALLRVVSNPCTFRFMCPKFALAGNP